MVHTLFGWGRRGVEAGGGRVRSSDGELGDGVALEQRRREHCRSLGLHLAQQVARVVETEVRRTALAASLTIRRQQVAADDNNDDLTAPMNPQVSCWRRIGPCTYRYLQFPLDSRVAKASDWRLSGLASSSPGRRAVE